MKNVNTTLTIRMHRALREKLRKGAKGLEKRDSELARELIEHGLEERTIYSRIGGLKGRLDKRRRDSDSLARSIRENNWRS